ncbi:MAG: glycosyltransferase [Sulfurimonas sp.]|nr:glycosyltransferase [Sulfurimonas sp.]
MGSKKLKIVYVSRSIFPSRTANSMHIMRMCQAFSDNGHEVTLLAPRTKKLEEKNVNNIFKYYGVKENFTLKKIYSPNIKYLKKIIYSFRCFNIIKKLQADVIYGRDDILTFYLAKKASLNTVFEMHAPLGENKFNDMLVKTLMQSNKKNKLVLISCALHKIMLNDFSFRKVDVLIAHDAADEIDINIKPSNLDINKKRLQIGYIGSLLKGRGIDIIIELANKLPQFDFHVVGGNEKDILFWKNKVSSTNILFHGFIKPSLSYQYRNLCDILLAPYQTAEEGNRLGLYQSPLKIFEYMASKKAIICSDLPNLREILQNNHNALLVSYIDIEEWVKAIQILANQNNTRVEIANNAHNDFISSFTWKSRANNILEFILKPN